MRCVQRRVLRWYDKNNDSLNFWNLTNDAPWIPFNQRARDSSSLERTKRKPTIHRFKCGVNRGFLFVISARRGLKSATEMRQLQRGIVSVPEHPPEDLVKNEWRGGIWWAEKTIFKGQNLKKVFRELDVSLMNGCIENWCLLKILITWSYQFHFWL